MSFLSQFSSYFTPAEKQTELYKLWSQIGVNTEKAYLETQEELNASMTDLNTLDEEIARSWLAFFLKKVPYRVTSKLGATVKAPVSVTSAVEVPRNSMLRSKTGIQWVLPEAITIQANSSRDVTLLQGRVATETGTYNSIIKIQATNPDLEYITVKIGPSANRIEVPEVSFFTSYDSFKYRGSWSPVNEKKYDNNGNVISGSEKTYGGTPFLENLNTKFSVGDMYNVTRKGSTKFSEDSEIFNFYVGDMVVYDGSRWTPISSATGLNPFQFQNNYVAPNAGYYAYFTDGFLYIKIYSGVTVINGETVQIDEPEGLEYEVEFLESDGKQGEIPSNESIEFESTFVDRATNEIVTLIVEHDSSSTSAVNEPSGGKMNLMLKERFYSGVNVSSIPEYTAWLKGQPEVGDCLVLSDYLKWVRGGKTGAFTVTGIVTVYAVDRSGNELSDDVKIVLQNRLNEVKDIAYVEFANNFSDCYDFFRVKYTQSLDNSGFETYVKDAIQQWFDVDFLQEHGSSIFSNLDLSKVLNNIVENDPTSATGVSIDAFHVVIPNTLQSGITVIEGLDGELPGEGFYKLYHTELNGSEIMVEQYVEKPRFRAGSAAIYNSEGDEIGTHNDMTVEIDLSKYAQDYLNSCRLECYFAMNDEGILTVGKDNGIRRYKGTECIVSTNYQ